MKGLMKRLVLGASLLALPMTISPSKAQENYNISIGINKISKEEGIRRIELSAFKLEQLIKKNSRDIEYEKVEKNISEIYNKCEDEKVRYGANFLMARSALEKNKKNIPRAFSFIEKCLLEYPKQEEKFGGSLELLGIMARDFSSRKKLISTSKCYELSKLSNSEKGNKKIIKMKLDDILNTDIGGLELGEALDKIFSPEQINAEAGYDVPFYVKKQWMNGKRDMGYNFPFTGVPGATPDLANIKKIKEIKIYSREKPFPEITLNLEYLRKQGKYPFKEKPYYKKIDLSKKIGEYGSRQRDPRGLLADAHHKAKRFEEVAGIYVNERDIYDYLKGNKRDRKVMGRAHPIIFKKGTKIRDLLEMGGINPYNWQYGNYKKFLED